MTALDSDGKLRKIICPECFEEMAREELIGTKCPLCGYALAKDEIEDDFSSAGDDVELVWLLIQNLQRTVIDWLMEYGASPLSAYNISYKVCCLDAAPTKSCKSTRFSFPAKMSGEEKAAEKICAKCGCTFMSGGTKVVSGDLFEPDPKVSYYCDECGT